MNDCCLYVLVLCYNYYMCCFLLFFFFFFFQAEDGIRDLYVTGVQTCALPIYGCRDPPAPRRPGGASTARREREALRRGALQQRALRRGAGRSPAARSRGRSEERRVGKECRSRWSPYQ